jgi:hypothetical protein
MAKAKKPSPAPDIDIPVSFKTVFWVVVVLTSASLLVNVYMAVFPPVRDTDALKKVVGACDGTWKAGFGAILGLLGGKRLP